MGGDTKCTKIEALAQRFEMYHGIRQPDDVSVEHLMHKRYYEFYSYLNYIGILGDFADWLKAYRKSGLYDLIQEDNDSLQYPAYQIVPFLVRQLNNRQMYCDNIKLNVALYLIELVRLQEGKTRLIIDDFHAQWFGPVIPWIYNHYRQFGDRHIIESNREMDSMYGMSADVAASIVDDLAFWANVPLSDLRDVILSRLVACNKSRLYGPLDAKDSDNKISLEYMKMDAKLL